jgi:hypothetical protein
MRRLVSLNTALAVASLGLVGYIGWQLARPAAEPTPARRPAPAPPAGTATPATTAAADTPPSAWTTIASRNLFSPTRSEAPAPGTPVGGGPALPRPLLYGVVLRDGAPVAYLEDPLTKRVAGYRIGDAIAGGTLQSITADRVVLQRPEGPVDVRLHDPAKPRPAAVAAPPAEGAGPVPPGAAAQRAPVVPGAGPPAIVPQPPVGAPVPQEVPAVPVRRPLPPNLLRRLPPTLSDAPNQ